MSSRDVDPTLPLLAEPAEGVPAVIDTPAALAQATAALAAGTGPVAVDAERAAGIRYDNRAFLIQLKRAGSGIVLLDPEALGSLAEVGEAIGQAEWVLHASSQDLPCLAETGMVPTELFDTELAARLLGLERCGLAWLIGQYLGVRLAKEHSYVDWSQRPLPHDWLAYAALDVDLLLPLREVLADELEAAGKTEIAREEFAHAALFTPKVHREPWRRVHGLGALKTRRGLGRVRAMWAVRDDLAEERDVAPSRIMADRAMVQAAGAALSSSKDLLTLPVRGRPSPADARALYSALTAADKLPEYMMPPLRAPSEGELRLNKAERERSREALTVMREALQAHAAQLSLPAELLLAPATVKDLAKHAVTREFARGGDEALIGFLTERRARPWQIEHTVPLLSGALATLSGR